MSEPFDWITPSLELMANDSRVAVANPNWCSNTLQQEAREWSGEFGVGYGFSDQLYLLRREEFARPIYKFHAPISLRYPMSARGRIFEQMIDSYMRVNGRMRATLSTAKYIHGTKEGISHAGLNSIAKEFQIRNSLILFTMKSLGLKHPEYYI